MKTRFREFFLLAPLLFAAYPMAPLSGQIVLAVGGGATIAKTTVDAHGITASTDSRVGITVGASATFLLSERIGLQVGGSYVQKGLTRTIVTFNPITVEAAADYVEVALLVKPSFPVTEGTVHLLLGPALGINVKCEVSEDGRAIPDPGCSGPDAVKSTDFGVVGGVGFRFKMVWADLTYTVALSDISDREVELFRPVVSEFYGKNRAFSIRAGVAFRVGG